MGATGALLNAPDAVMRVPRGYAEVGCDVISTNPWGIQSAMNGEHGPAGAPSADWMQLARRAIGLARRATAEVGRSGDTAGGLSPSRRVPHPPGLQPLELLRRPFGEEPPDFGLLAASLPLPRLTFPAG